MASIDKLSIDITASATGVKRAIDNIVDNLGKLSQNLQAFESNSKSIESVANMFDTMATSINKIDSEKLKTVNSSLRSMAYAIEKLGNTANLIDLSPASVEAKKVNDAVNEATKALCQHFGVEGKKGVHAVRSALAETLSEIEKVNAEGGDVNFEAYWKDTATAIRENVKEVNVLESEYGQLIEYIKAQNASGQKIFLPFNPKEYINDYKSFRATLGKVFTSNEQFAKNTDIVAFVEDLNKSLEMTIPIGNTAQETFINLVDALRQARGTAESSSQSWIDANMPLDQMKKTVQATTYSLAMESEAIKEAVASAETPVQGNAIDQIFYSLQNLQNISIPDSSGVAELAKNISKFNNKGVSKAVENLPKMTKVLSESLTELSKAPQISQSVIDMTNALANFNKTATRTSSSSKPLISTFNNVSHSAKRAGTSFRGLASSIGMFYAKFFLIIRGVKALWSAIGSSMDFIETYNYFESAMDQVANRATEDWSMLGYESEQAYEDSFREASLDLTKKMSGYLVGDEGILTSANEINLGLDPNKMLSYQAQFSQMASSMGVASDQAVDLSNALTMIGADLASVKNMEFEDVWSNMASGMVGMSRAVDKYGINLREASLNEALANLGIDATVKSLSGADKALLRTIVILQSSEYAWGDLADTIEQPRNQLRMLENNWTSLCRNVGNIFSGWVNSMLPYINALVIALQRLAQWIINVFSISIPTTSSEASNDISDLNDLIYGTDDALDEASGSAKKLKNNLLGIDELNVLNNDDSSGSGAGGGASSNLELQKAFDEIYQQYQDAWNEAYNNVTSRAQDMADAICDAFKKGDYKEIGTIISTAIRDALDSIPWESIYNVAKNFGTNFANFLNGLIRPDTFYSVGRTLANALNTAFYFFGSFVETFDWANLGLSLASGLQGFVDNIDAEYWGKAISNALIGILTSAEKFLANAPWFEIGQKIGIFLSNIDWGTILFKVAKVAMLALNGMLTVIAGIFDANGLVGLIVTGIVGFITLDKILGIASKFYSLFTNNNVVKLFTQAGAKNGNALASAITTEVNSTTTISKVGSVASKVADHFCTILMGVIAGYNIGEWIAEQCFGEEYKVSVYIDNVVNNEAYSDDKERWMNYATNFAQASNDAERIQALADANYELAHSNETVNANAHMAQEAMREYTTSLDLVANTLGVNSEAYQHLTSLVDANTESGRADLAQIQQMMNVLGASNVAMSDTASIQAILNDSMYECSDTTKDYILTLSQNYDQLGVTGQAILDYKYGIEVTNDTLNEFGGNTAVEDLAKQTIQARTDYLDYGKAVDSASDSTYDFESAINRVNTNGMPTNVRELGYVQKALQDHVKANDSSILSLQNYQNAIGNCSGAINGLKTNFTDLDIATTQIAKNGMPSYVAEIMASSTASSQLTSDLGALSTATESTTAYFETANGYVSAMTDSIFAMSGTAIPTLQTKFEELGSTIYNTWKDADSDTSTYSDSIYTTVSTTEATMLEELDTNLTTAKTNISTVMLEIETNVKTTFTNMQNNIKTTFEAIITDSQTQINNTITWFEANIVPKFSYDNFMDILGGIPQAFEQTFKNAMHVVAGVINSMVDEINDAFDISWDSVEINGKEVVSAGSAKILEMSHIQGFAQGGFPTAGDLFYANENGAEMVGSFGNRTAVANNDQIVAGITNGVRSAVADVMLPYLVQISDNTRETANKDFSVNIGDRDIARANVRGQRSMGRTLISTT